MSMSASATQGGRNKTHVVIKRIRQTAKLLSELCFCPFVVCLPFCQRGSLKGYGWLLLFVGIRCVRDLSHSRARVEGNSFQRLTSVASKTPKNRILCDKTACRVLINYVSLYSGRRPLKQSPLMIVAHTVECLYTVDEVRGLALWGRQQSANGHMHIPFRSKNVWSKEVSFAFATNA